MRLVSRGKVDGERLGRLHLYLVAGREEGVEADDELRMALEQHGDARYDAGRVDRLGLELLHDVEEVVVDLRLVAELVLDLVEVGQGVLHLQPLEGGAAAAGGQRDSATALKKERLKVNERLKGKEKEGLKGKEELKGREREKKS